MHMYFIYSIYCTYLWFTTRTLQFTLSFRLQCKMISCRTRTFWCLPTSRICMYKSANNSFNVSAGLRCFSRLTIYSILILYVSCTQAERDDADGDGRATAPNEAAGSCERHAPVVRATHLCYKRRWAHRRARLALQPS